MVAHREQEPHKEEGEFLFFVVFFVPFGELSGVEI